MVKVSRQRSAELRIELLDAAAAELRRVGYDAMALTTVASNCGLATSAIYNRFADKPALIAALIEERVEPALGPVIDAEAVTFWNGEGTAPSIDQDQMAAVIELLLAARHNPPIRESVYGFIRRRMDFALSQRALADQRGEVRSGLDPHTQVMLRASEWVSTYIYSMVSPRPDSGFAGLNELSRIIVKNVPHSTPLPVEPPATRRIAPPVEQTEPTPLDELGERLVAAATEVYSTVGYEAATVADIARLAELTTGAIYNRFSGKAGLMCEVILREIGPPAHQATVALVGALSDTAGTDPSDVVRAVFSRLHDPEFHKGRSLRIAARDASRREPEVAAVVRPLQDWNLADFAEITRASQAEGVTRPDIDPEAVAWWVLANPLGMTLLLDVVPQAKAEDWAEIYTVALAVLRTQPS